MLAFVSAAGTRPRAALLRGDCVAWRPAGKRPKQKDTQQLARSVLDQIAPDAEPTKPAANKAQPPSPKKKRYVADIEGVDLKGMAQPQAQAPKEKNPAAVALGKLGGLKGGKARAEKLSAAKRKAIAKKAAVAMVN